LAEPGRTERSTAQSSTGDAFGEERSRAETEGEVAMVRKAFNELLMFLSSGREKTADRETAEDPVLPPVVLNLFLAERGVDNFFAPTELGLPSGLLTDNANEAGGESSS